MPPLDGFDEYCFALSFCYVVRHSVAVSISASDECALPEELARPLWEEFLSREQPPPDQDNIALGLIAKQSSTCAVPFAPGAMAASNALDGYLDSVNAYTVGISSVSAIPF
jgi:hypothetical protein